VKLALLADIHANLPALEAVLNDLPPVDGLLCAGDVVGYYADPNEVCRRLRELDVPTIRGNHDAYVLGALAASPERAALYRADWTRDRLEPANRAWLAALPTGRAVESGGVSVDVRHASPWDEVTYLYPDSPRLEEIRLDAGQVLVLGHTHHPMQRRCGEGLVVNPGSVGQPRDWNPLASYAVLDVDSRQVEFRRVAYPVRELQARLTALGWDPGVIATLSRSRAAAAPAVTR
jgi:predicted phosphodiesterase